MYTMWGNNYTVGNNKLTLGIVKWILEALYVKYAAQDRRN